MTTIPHNSPTITVATPPAAPLLKRPLEAALSAWVTPRIMIYRVLRRLIGAERAMGWLSESIAHRPGPLGVLLRAAAYRRVLRHVGRDVFIGFGTLVSKEATEIGDGAYVGRRCSLGWARVGPGAHIADGVHLLSGSGHHRARSGVAYQQITIGSRAWIGAGAVVMADVGEGATVGAGAVVTRPVPAGVTVVGVPARALEKA